MVKATISSSNRRLQSRRSHARSSTNKLVSMTSEDGVSPRYAQFVQAVRAFRPSDLIPAISSYGATHANTLRLDGSADMSRPPWAILAMVRESIAVGSEHRSRDITPRSIDRLFNLFGQSHDEHDSSLTTILNPIFYEQFQHQESLFEELSRVGPLLFEKMPGCKSWPWEDLFSGPPEKLINAAFVLFGLAQQANGRVDPAVLDSPGMQEVFTKLASREQVEALLARLSRSISEARAVVDSRETPAPHQRRYAYNPLLFTPIIDTERNGLWAPLPQQILRSVSPSGLYFAGKAAWGNAFTNDLGTRVQEYVGRQLGLSNAYDLIPEIKYDNDQLSVDWILVSPEAVILVECKSARMSMEARLGGPPLRHLVERSIGKGRVQIDRTAALIRNQHPAFSAIPRDRPTYGLIVTAEPFYLANTAMGEFEDEMDTTAMVASLRDIEHLMQFTPESVLEILVEVLDDPEKRTWQLSKALPKTESRQKNALLDNSWNSLELGRMVTDRRAELDAASLPRQSYTSK